MTKIRRLLVANRGEIARRIMRTAHCMGIETVAVYSAPDAQSLHVREASAAQALGGKASADTYLRIDKLLAAARAAAVDAVHPGYGFLSENAEFAQSVLDAGLVWIGPPPAAMRALGNKASAKALALTCGVPCLAGYNGEDQSDARLMAEASRIGFPLMVKAAAGGGGRGMRLVTAQEQLPAALQSARSEARAAFGSGELLLERALLQARHVEMQIVADTHRRCIYLGERDCSVQRRHQKLVEETPSPAVDDALRQRLGLCATGLAQAAGYVGVGTVEFLLQDDDFFLIEMNTRLQVEHSVTEAVTGLDLVEWQFRIAQGEPLPLTQEQVRFSGHAIEVRLCAEDENFSPHSGTVQRFVPPVAAIRFDHAIVEGMVVTPHYDSMLGKLIARAPTRAEAVDQLVTALAQLQLLGVPTNRGFLAACLDHQQFRAGRALVPFLEHNAGAIRDTLHARQSGVLVQAALAVAFHRAQAGGAASSALRCPFPRPLRFRHGGDVLELRVREADGGMLEVQIGGATHTSQPPRAACVRLDSGDWHVQVGSVDLFLRDISLQPLQAAASAGAATELRAPFNGKVISVKVAAGSRVAQGDTLLVIESMKLEHVLAATCAAVIQAVHVEASQQVATGQLLASVQPRT